MKRRSHRPERVSELIRQAVGAFLTGAVRDPRIGFVTVTGVDVSPDLSHANVRVSVMGSDEEKATSLEGLASARAFCGRSSRGSCVCGRAPSCIFIWTGDSSTRSTSIGC